MKNLLKKIWIAILPLILLAQFSYAQGGLWDFFTDTIGFLPSVSERAVEYERIWPEEKYRGTAEQNTKFLGFLERQENALGPLDPTEERFGSTFETPDVTSFFEDTLAASITTTDTSFTLVDGKDAHDVNLASSTYGFIIDEGTSVQEMVMADCTATVCTNSKRGLDFNTATSTRGSAAKAHRRGASVKITDAPFLIYIGNVFKGRQKIENKLKYNTASSSCVAGDPDGTICGKEYTDNSVNAGAATSTELRGGLVELATAAEQAASTNISSDKPLALYSKYATSTPSATATLGANYTVIANTAGRLAPGWLAGTAENYDFNGATTTISSATTTFDGTNPVVGIGTTTPGLKHGLTVATSTYIAGGLGVGIATTSAGNLQVSGDVQITGALSVGGGGLFAKVGSNTTEVCTSGNLDTPLQSITGLNIAAATPFKLMFNIRRSSGSGNGAGNFDIELNNTIITGSSTPFSTTVSQAESGLVSVDFGPRVTGYPFSAIGHIATSSAITWGVSNPAMRVDFETAIPTVAITEIDLHARSSTATLSLCTDEMFVYTYP